MKWKEDKELIKSKKEQKVLRAEIRRRTEKYMKEAKQQTELIEELRDQAMQKGDFFVEAEPKLAFVIRIKGLKAMSPKERKVLQLLRLRQTHNGVFVKINACSIKMLRIAERYITWGYPNAESVRKLIYKRGYAKLNGQRIGITNNTIIQEVLKKKDIISIEDLIHEINTVGPNFKYASNFLWPFKLNTPKKGYKSTKIHFVEGGDCGNREEYINELIERML